MCDALITYKEAAAALGVSERTIRRLVVRRVLTCVSVTGNGCLRITKRSVERHLALLLAEDDDYMQMA
jgi:excisionase family DNA binding protein